MQPDKNPQPAIKRADNAMDLYTQINRMPVAEALILLHSIIKDGSYEPSMKIAARHLAAIQLDKILADRAHDTSGQKIDAAGREIAQYCETLPIEEVFVFMDTLQSAGVENAGASIHGSLPVLQPVYTHIATQRPEPFVSLYGKAAIATMKTKASLHSGVSVHTMNDTDIRNSEFLDVTLRRIADEFGPEYRKAYVAHDDIGIFTPEGNIVAIAVHKQKKRGFVLHYIEDMVVDPYYFPHQTNHTPQELVQLVQRMYKPEMQMALQEFLTVPLADNPLRGQLQIFDFLLHGTPEETARIQEIFDIKTGKADYSTFTTTFFAVFPNQPLRTQLLAAEQTLPTEQYNAITQSYSTIVNALDSYEQHIRETVGADDIAPGQVPVDTRTAVQRYIEASHARLSKALKTGSAQELTELNTDIAIQASILNAARSANPDFSFEDAANMRVLRVSAEELAANDVLRESYLNGLRGRYPNDHYAVTSLSNLLLGTDPETVAQRKRTQCELLTQIVQGKMHIITAFAMEDRGDHLYSRSYFADDSTAGHGIGFAFVEERFPPYQQDNIIRADAETMSPATAIYLDRYHYNAIHFVEPNPEQELYNGYLNLQSFPLQKGDPSYWRTQTADHIESNIAAEYSDALLEQQAFAIAQPAKNEELLALLRTVVNTAGFAVTKIASSRQHGRIWCFERLTPPADSTNA